MQATEAPADRQPSPPAETATVGTPSPRCADLPPSGAAVSEVLIRPSPDDYWHAQTLLIRDPSYRKEFETPPSIPPSCGESVGAETILLEPPPDPALEGFAKRRAIMGGNRFDLSTGLREPKYAIDFVHLKCVEQSWTDSRYEMEIRRCQNRPIELDMVGDVYTALIQNALSYRSLFELAARCEQCERDQRDQLVKEFARRFVGMQHPLPVSATEIRTVDEFVENLDQRRRRVVSTGSGRHRTAIKARMKRIGVVSSAWNSAGLRTGASHPDFGRSKELRAASAVIIARQFLSMVSPSGCIRLINELIQALEEEQQIAETAFQAKSMQAQAAAPAPSGSPSPQKCSLYCKSGIWTLDFRGESRPLSRAKGFALIAHQLLNPGKEFKPIELEEAALIKTSVRSEAAAETESDLEARRARASKIKQLRSEIRTAVDDGDPQLAENLGHTLEQLRRLHHSEYHNKKPRRIDPAHTKSRQRVDRNIRTAMEILSAKWPEAYTEFREFFKQGGVFMYRQQPDLVWTASPEPSDTPPSVTS